MASFGSYPQNVTFQTVNVQAGGGSENLLINPRGKINQAGEPDGVLSAGQYFCDGWKAGAAGAEVYIDPDGFRIISGSIVQLVPNNLEVGRTIRGNMDIISGAPVISINGGGDNVLSDAAEYIQFEVSGNNAKFTRLILAESVSLPIYQQSIDEMATCTKFYFKEAIERKSCYPLGADSTAYRGLHYTYPRMHKTPAVNITKLEAKTNGVLSANQTSLTVYYEVNLTNQWGGTAFIELDARP